MQYRYGIHTVSILYRCSIDTESKLYLYSIDTVSILYRYNINTESIQYRLFGSTFWLQHVASGPICLERRHQGDCDTLDSILRVLEAQKPGNHPRSVQSRFRGVPGDLGAVRGLRLGAWES